MNRRLKTLYGVNLGSMYTNLFIRGRAMAWNGEKIHGAFPFPKYEKFFIFASLCHKISTVFGFYLVNIGPQSVLSSCYSIDFDAYARIFLLHFNNISFTPKWCPLNLAKIGYFLQFPIVDRKFQPFCTFSACTGTGSTKKRLGP